MRAVNVGIGHDDDAVIAELVWIIFLAPDATAHGGDQGAHLLGRNHAIKTCAFHIQNFALQGQDGLGATITALLGGTASGIALDDE